MKEDWKCLSHSATQSRGVGWHRAGGAAQGWIQKMASSGTRNPLCPDVFLTLPSLKELCLGTVHTAVIWEKEPCSCLIRASSSHTFWIKTTSHTWTRGEFLHYFRTHITTWLCLVLCRSLADFWGLSAHISKNMLLQTIWLFFLIFYCFALRDLDCFQNLEIYNLQNGFITGEWIFEWAF